MQSLLYSATTWRPDDLGQFASVQPVQLTSAATVYDNITWTVIRMSVHSFEARWTIHSFVKLFGVNHHGAVIDTLVFNSHELDSETQGNAVDQKALTAGASASLSSIERSDLQLLVNANRTRDVQFVARKFKSVQ